jgi:hypothetical protein
MSDFLDSVNKLTAAMRAVHPFLPLRQLAAMGQLCRGEEREFYKNKFLSLSELIESMPVTRQQDGKGKNSIAYLHYFAGGSDWYITEKDIKGGIQQAFGFASINAPIQSGEFGYISIMELAAAGVELDLYFTPKPLNEILGVE